MQYGYDADERLSTIRDALGNAATYSYDSGGNVISVQQPTRSGMTARTTSFAYDARNRMTTVPDAIGDKTVLAYDAAGNTTSVADPLGLAAQYGYDALNRATTLIDARSGIITLTYDAAGRQTVVVDPVGNRTAFAYDAADRVTTQTDAQGTVAYAYDLDDRLLSKTDRLGRQITYAYDLASNPTLEKWINADTSVARTITSTDDLDNELTTVADTDANLSFSYDSGGRLTSTNSSGSGTGQPNETLTYGYDASNKRTSMTDSLASVGRTTYQYDAAQRLTTLTRPIGGTEKAWVAFGYDAASRVTSIKRTTNGSGTAVTSSLAYDSSDRLTTLTHQVSGGSTLATSVYGYDSGGRLVTENNAEGLATYGYDNTNQLTSVDRVGTSGDETYGYDLAGNRNTTGYTTAAGNELTASPGATYTYDAEGNLSARTDTATHNVWSYAYDQRNRMTGTTEKNSGGSVIFQATYTYDALDRRIAVKTDADGAGAGSPVTLWTAYDGDNTYADFDGSGTLKTRYLYGPAVDELLARTDSGGTTAWYLTDRLGSVRDIASTAGSVIDHLAYDGFGQVTSESSPSNGDRFKFTAREVDSGTGLQFNRHRYYQVSIGRWTQIDPIGFASLDFAMYRYLENSPSAAMDPFGFRDWGTWGGRLTVVNGEAIRQAGWEVGYIPEHEANGSSGVRILPIPDSGTVMADAIVVHGPHGGLYKIDNLNRGRVWVAEDGSLKMDTVDRPVLVTMPIPFSNNNDRINFLFPGTNSGGWYHGSGHHPFGSWDPRTQPFTKVK